MASFYESATSGFNSDRFVDEFQGVGHESTIVKIKEKFWTAKQIFCDKLKLNTSEDGQSQLDNEFTNLLARFNSVRENTGDLLNVLKRYNRLVTEIADAEQSLSVVLASGSKQEDIHLKQFMKASASAFSELSNQRLKLIMPLARVHHELKMFDERAVADCVETADATKHSNAEYRGAIFWMRSIKELDPERSRDRHMEEFRTSQKAAKKAKKRFDQLNEDFVYKVDLLVNARSKLLADVLKEYAYFSEVFYTESTKELDEIISRLPSANNYEIDILKLINEELVDNKPTESGNEPSPSTSKNDKTENDNEIRVEKLIELLQFDDEHNTTDNYEANNSNQADPTNSVCSSSLKQNLETVSLVKKIDESSKTLGSDMQLIDIDLNT